MEKAAVRKSAELLKLENPNATAEGHLSKLLCMKGPKLYAEQGNKFKTHRLHPNSVLDRVKGFLPHMKQANDDLQEAIEDRGQTEFDIENVEHVDDVIEMNLAVVERDEDSSDDCSSDDDKSDTSANSHKCIIETLSSSTDGLRHGHIDVKSNGPTEDKHD